MKKTIISTLTGIFFILSVHVVMGESALLGWKAGSGPTVGLPVILEIVMRGPSQMNELPERKGVFFGHYSFKLEWSTVLKEVHLVSLNEASGIVTREINFEFLHNTEKITQPLLVKTEFQTESVIFGEGDVFALVFKTADGEEMVFVRIGHSFIHMR